MRGIWYALVAIPVAIFVGILLADSAEFASVIEQAPRVVVPGTGEVALEPGDYTVYGETRSVLHGVEYHALSLSLRCDMKAVSDGESIATRPKYGSERYRFIPYEGKSMFEVTIAHSGWYRVHCKGSGDQGTLAFGTGQGIAHLVLDLLILAIFLVGTVVAVQAARGRRVLRGT